MWQDNSSSDSPQAAARAQVLADQCYLFCKPLLTQSDRLLDRRLVETFLSLVMHRQRNQGLLLSELGGFVDHPAQAPADNKQISRLLHAVRWDANLIEEPFWHQADERSQDHTLTWDARRRWWRKTGLETVRVYDPAWGRPLWLVVSRFGVGKEPWSLLTNEPSRTGDQAWRIVFAYARRWQIEMAIRSEKCELALETPRLRDWDVGARLQELVSLAYPYLLTLLAPPFKMFCERLLRQRCHRTG